MKCAQRNGKKAKEISRERNKVYLSCSDADDRWLVCISLIIWLQLLENPHTLTLKLHCIQKKKKRLRSNRYGENKSRCAIAKINCIL